MTSLFIQSFSKNFLSTLPSTVLGPGELMMRKKSKDCIDSEMEQGVLSREQNRQDLAVS